MKEVPLAQRRKRKGEEASMSNDEIDATIKSLSALLTLSDEIYSICLSPGGSLTNEKLDDIENTVKKFCIMWRQCGLSATPKLHIIEHHLVDMFLRRFRGLGEYDKSFMERGHQDRKKLEQRSSNVKKYDQKAVLHARWSRSGETPKVRQSIDRHGSERKRRKIDDSRTIIINDRKNERRSIYASKLETS